MITWFASNIGTIIISGMLIGLVAAIVFFLHRSRKKRSCTCGGSCSHCPMGGSCHSEPKKETCR